jgi:hypothetical protein
MRGNRSIFRLDLRPNTYLHKSWSDRSNAFDSNRWCSDDRYRVMKANRSEDTSTSEAASESRDGTTLVILRQSSARARCHPNKVADKHFRLEFVAQTTDGE